MRNHFFSMRRKKNSLRTALATDAHPSKFYCAGNGKAMRTRLKTIAQKLFFLSGKPESTSFGQ